jgi:trimeric autotransporter adhesin
MTKARILADFISDGSSLADGTISVAEVSGAAPLASPTFTGTASGTFSGPLTGAVTGNVTGAVTGNVTGNLTGDVLGDLDLTAISATIADTAVDIFVYDTSKDSDGGAWRKRTQGTSWYNETLGTGTRGSRKEFPAVAVIVAEATQITIYDGDDPDLPMWMVFNTAAANMLRGTGARSSVVAKNGDVAVGAVSDALVQVSFISDSAVHRDLAGGRIYLGNIAERNGALGNAGYTTNPIISNAVNDIAMTVLPNAPIDAATGLPVPTIAVATDGGVSVITDSGAVYDITGESTYTKVMRLAFTSDNKIKYTLDYSGDAAPYSRYVRVDAIPSADFVATSTSYVKGNSLEFYSASPTVDSDLYFLADVNTVANPNLVIGKAYGTKFGLTTQDRNPTTPANGMVAYATSSYNTGWMNGDIKLATLSDTDDTNVTGAELVTNGTFDSNTSGWTAGDGATVTHQSGRMRVDGNVGTANQAITTVVGKSYTVSADLFNGTSASSAIYVSTTTSSSQMLATFSSPANSVTFTATSTTTYIIARVNAASNTYIEVDNISVRLAEPDRSVNANGLQVFGTITKTAVATGADLVAYTGFSSSNFMVQPYNSDLDFGTGDFSIMGWINVGSSVSPYASILSRVLSANSETNAWSLRIDSSANNYYFYTNNTSLLTSPLTRLTWQFLTVARRSGVVYFYVNGAFRTTNSMANTITNVGACVVVGYESTHNMGNSSVALWRISATAPSPEQIAKIYEDEKVLFQENAQATLYGSSDAVTALAYDDTTELLHVGTSEGRSVFQGLRRVDNTTDAVGAAISASNGLVAED